MILFIFQENGEADSFAKTGESKPDLLIGKFINIVVILLCLCGTLITLIDYLFCRVFFFLQLSMETSLLLLKIKMTQKFLPDFGELDIKPDLF